MDAKIRRTEDNLFVLGTGVVVFELWDLLKYVFYFFNTSSEVRKMIDETDSVFVVIVLWSFIIIGFLIRCYVGLSARGEGKGKRKGAFYLIVTGLLVLCYLAVVFLEIAAIIMNQAHLFSSVITLIIDATSLAFLVELMINSIRIRKLRKDNAV